MTIFAVVDLVAIQVETWLTDPTGSHVNVHRILAVDIPAWDDDDGYRATHFVDGRGRRTADEFDDDCRAITIATVPTAQVFATLIANAHQIRDCSLAGVDPWLTPEQRVALQATIDLHLTDTPVEHQPDLTDTAANEPPAFE